MAPLENKFNIPSILEDLRKYYPDMIDDDETIIHDVALKLMAIQAKISEALTVLDKCILAVPTGATRNLLTESVISIKVVNTKLT